MWDYDDEDYAPQLPPNWLVIVCWSALVCVLVALVSGCGPTTGDKPKAVGEPFQLDPVLYRDQVTGCQYLSTSGLYTLTPRIAADGKTHMGCKAVAP